MTFVLDATNKAIKFTITAGAGADVHFTSHWADATASGLTEGQTQGTSNGSTAVDAVAAPAASTRRVVKLITFHNTSTTTSRTVTLVNDVGGTSRTIAVFTLAPLATWYSDTAATTAIADGDKGDITVSGSGATWTIDPGAVTLAKMANMATDSLIGRDTAGTGSPEVITLSQALDFVGSAAQGDILYRGASSWTRLGAGTRGRYLQTGGASADPSWTSDVAFKNVLINGDMRVSQRGTSFTNATLVTNANRGYTLDRWFIQSEGPSTTFANDIINVIQSTNAPAEATGLFESRINSIELDPVTGITTRKFGIAQIVEQRNCRHLRGAVASLSFKARVSATSIGDVRAVVLAWTSTADNTATTNLLSSWGAGAALPTWDLNMTQCNTPANLNVTSSWATYRIENISIPNTMNNLVVFIWNNDRDYSAADSLFITDVQLEPGPVATEFEYLPYEVQEERCARYLPRGVVGPLEHFFGGGNLFLATAAIILVPYSIRARVRPTGISWTPADFEMYDLSVGGGPSNPSTATDSFSESHGLLSSVLRVRSLVGGVYRTFAAGAVCFLVAKDGAEKRILFTGCEL